jgi:hypothetical protein
MRSRLHLASSPLLVSLLFVVACAGDEPESMLEGSTGDAASTGAETSATEPQPGSESSAASADSTGDESGTTGEPPIVIDCTDACADTQSDAGIAVCYSCRCKAAMDGWLPSREELQCGLAEPIEVYTADVSGPEAVLSPAAPDATTCANPSLLTDSCQAGSRLGQITNGDIEFKWICRDPYDNGGAPQYADAGAVAYNRSTGASCWWDDVDFVSGDDDWPSLDLMEGDADNLARHLEVFYATEGEHCTGCHDNDPFIYTPYLQSVMWPIGAHVAAPFSITRVDGSQSATPNVHLVSREVAACTKCHRLSSAATCEFLSADSMGLNKGLYSYEQAVLDAADPTSPHWRLAWWMPHGPPEVETYAEWIEGFGEAADRVAECCANPGVETPTCAWAPIPAEG